ncbi:MAG: PAS domain S-box protein [Candidatus Odinarchaeota archaeon]
MGIAILQNGLFKYVNEKFIEICGYSAEEIKSWAPNEFSKFIHTEDRDFVIEQESKKQAGDPDVFNQFKFRIIRKDGKIRWVEIFSKTIPYEGYPADLVTINDITDKIKAERQLRDSEEKFSKVFNSNILSMSITSLEEGKFIEVNDAFLRFLGRSREEIIGKTTNELGLWLNEKVRKRFLRILDKQESLFNIETKDILRTGETKYGLVSYIKIILNDKPFILSILNNITPWKLAEQQLKDLDEKFEYIVEQSLLGITILQDGKIKYVNKKVAETSGYSIEEIKGWHPNEHLEVVHPEDREFITEQALKKQIADPDAIDNYIYRIIKKDGTIGWRETFSKTIIYEGRPAGFGIHIDITEKIENEQKLKESKQKYLRAYNKAEFYKDLFIHDINNTLQSLYSSTQLIDMNLEKDRKNNIIKELLDIMYRQLNRGINLISNIRKLSQLENHEISFKEVDFFEVLKRSIEFLKNTFQDRKIQIKYDISCENVLIIGNDLLQDVFENILINSVRHNNNDCVEIVIKTSLVKQDDKSYCRLEFIDNGIGIEDERKKSVLTRADPDAKTTYGMGLGLSLVKKIIDSYGGKIWIEDKVEGDCNKGTKVILLIKKVVLDNYSSNS